MIIHTAAEGITLAKKLEEDSAKFYGELAKLFSNNADSFQGLANDNKKNITNIQRTYYGVITDALEGGYAFNLETSGYAIETAVSKELKLADAIKKAVKIEDTIIKFYNEAAAQSQGLMADVPRVFSVIARKRGERIPKLEALS